MAKIGELEVDSIKIKDGALTDWFSPSGSSITVTNNSGSPTFIWLTAETSCSLSRSRDGKSLYSGTGAGQRVFVADADPQSSETYTISGGTLVGAKVRKA